MDEFPDDDEFAPEDEEFDADAEYERELERQLDLANRVEDGPRNKVSTAQRNGNVREKPVRRNLGQEIDACDKTVETVKDTSRHKASEVQNGQKENNIGVIKKSAPDIQDVTIPKRSAAEVVEELVARYKRTADDCDVLGAANKRQRLEDNADSPVDEFTRLEQRIMEARAKRAATSRANPVAPAPAVRTDHISYNIPRWPFTPVTRGDDTRVYVRLEPEEVGGVINVGAGRELANHLHHLYRSVWTEANKFLEDKLVAKEVEVVASETDAGADGAQLWVERYRPRLYTELVSDEAENRAVLRWLKLWDKVVFGRDVRGVDTRPQVTAKPDYKPGTDTKVVESELEADGWPRRRTLLLAGPPGAGKTTLAHLLARHAGYRPLEVNASDERSAEALKTLLLNATSMQATLRPDTRPNCVILDEIDGAPQPTVDAVVKLVTLGGGKKGGGRLRRPVICICNDMWTPALRSLRSAALVVTVSGATPARLARRLEAACAREHVRAEPAALEALAVRAGGDVRAALAALHLLAHRYKQVRVCDVESLTEVGRRDLRAGLPQLLRRLLAPADDTSALLHALQAFGEYERLANCVLENVGTCARDSAAASLVLHVLHALDRVLSYVQRHQQYFMLSHAGLWLVRVRSALRLPARAPPSLANDAELRRAVEAAAAARRAVRRGAVPGLLPYLSRSSIALDVLPLVAHVVTPAVRAHNPQLASEREREALISAARIRLDLALDSFSHDELVKLACCYGERVRRPPPHVQLAIQRESGLETVRRARLQMRGAPASQLTPNDAASKAGADSKMGTAAVSATLPNHLQRLSAAPLRTKEHVARDMFGRVIGSSAACGSGARVAESCGFSLHYQYREGYNNAVRRSVKLAHLL